MVDPDSIRRRLAEIGRRLEALGQIHNEGLDRVRTDFRLRAEAEHHIQVAIQASIDVANHIVAEDSSFTPEDYASTFVLLAKMGVIEAALAEKLRRAAGLRNVIVHGYLEVDIDQLWAALGRLADLETFASGVERYLTT